MSQDIYEVLSACKVTYSQVWGLGCRHSWRPLIPFTLGLKEVRILGVGGGSMELSDMLCACSDQEGEELVKEV